MLHPLPSLATAAVTVVLALLFRVRPSDPKLLLLFATMLMAQFSISVLNDWADRDADAAAGKQRPIALGVISPATGLWLAAIFASTAIAGALVLGALPTLILVVQLVAGWAYDLLLKPTPFSFLPFAIAFPLLVFWVAAAADQPVHLAPLILAAGVPLAIAIHIADGAPDRTVDSSAHLRTLTVFLGRPAAEIVAAVLLLVASAVAWLALLSVGCFTPSVLILALFPALYLASELNRSSANPVWTPQLAKWTLVAGASLTGLAVTLAASHG